MGHPELAKLAGLGPDIVGGEFDGLDFNEKSGRYWQNWTDDIRESFRSRVNGLGRGLGFVSDWC